MTEIKLSYTAQLKTTGGNERTMKAIHIKTGISAKIEFIEGETSLRHAEKKVTELVMLKVDAYLEGDMNNNLPWTIKGISNDALRFGFTGINVSRQS